MYCLYLYFKMKKPVFAEGQIYHVFNRGVDKRDIFLDDKDYLRFIHDLYEFNDIKPVRNAHYFSTIKPGTWKLGNYMVIKKGIRLWKSWFLRSCRIIIILC